MRLLLRASLLSALLAASGGCGGDSTGTPGPSRVTIAGGGDQAGPAGQVLANPVIVQVTDGDGDPVQGVEVRFAVAAGGGSITPAAATTDAQGNASAQWRLGTVTADSQQVQVQVIGGDGKATTSAVVRATAQPLAAQGLVRVSSESQFAQVNVPMRDSLTVRVVDVLGNGVPGATVTWTVPSFSGTVSPASTVTRADGTAKAVWTPGPAINPGQAMASVAGISAGVGFSAAVSSAFTIIFSNAPAADGTYGDVLTINDLYIASLSGAIVRSTARVEDRAVNLDAGRGTLNLAGLAEGPKTLQIWAVNVLGDSAMARRPFVYRRTP